MHRLRLFISFLRQQPHLLLGFAYMLLELLASSSSVQSPVFGLDKYSLVLLLQWALMQRADPVASTISDPSRLRLAQFFSTHDDEFRDTFRMSKRTFNRLCASITLRRDRLLRFLIVG